MSTVISVENLGKKYIIGHQRQQQYLTLRDTIAERVKEAGRRLLHPFLSSSGQPLIGLATTEEFWALKDVSFEIQQGERVGIIGRNGAGKTTLLKLLSRITEPTTGRLKINGRVASLLEVGTGFHPELTGRENIFLNGAILGMAKAEINSRFDEIVAFAEVEKFLDTPVKRYSSGMYVRLAFAVAAHLEQEILVVDEVLSVGDAEFQRKCLGKMGEVAKLGRTVLFVSHALAAVQSLCTRGIVLDKGKILFDGMTDAAIQRYMISHHDGTPVIDLARFTRRSGRGDILLTSFRIEDHSGCASGALLNGKPCTFILGFVVQTPNKSYDNVAATITVKNMMGSMVFYHHNLLTGQPFQKVKGQGEFRLHIPRLPLSTGRYWVDLDISLDRGYTILDAIHAEVSFEVCDGDFFGTGAGYRGGMTAAVMVDGVWERRVV